MNCVGVSLKCVGAIMQSPPLKYMTSYDKNLQKTRCPLGEFVRANRQIGNQLDWLATNTDVITTQSHSFFRLVEINFTMIKGHRV